MGTVDRILSRFQNCIVAATLAEAAFLVVLSAACVAPAEAFWPFSEYLDGHNRINVQVLAGTFSECAIKVVNNCGECLDLECTQYHPYQHFDRPDYPAYHPPWPADPTKLCDQDSLTDEAAFLQGRAFVFAQKTLVLNGLKASDPEGALCELGRGLHTLEDLFAHSNYANQGGDGEAACLAALFDTTLAFPVGLRLTCSSNAAGDCYHDQNPDCGSDAFTAYSHMRYAKDKPFPTGVFKKYPCYLGVEHDIAVRGAITAARRYIDVLESEIMREPNGATLWQSLIS